jgi:hypothetical protein
MAGAGIKLFQTDDILTAADVNVYFMDQVVSVFANAGARASAFGGVGKPALSYGRVSYLLDEKKLYIYTPDGNAGSPGWTPQLATVEDGVITTAKIVNNAVTSAKLASHASTDGNRAVTTDHIRNEAVTGAKIAPNAIDSSHIAPGTIIESDILDGSITSDKIANLTIVDGDINASAAIGLSKLATGTLPSGIKVVDANIASAAISQSKVNGLTTSLDGKLGSAATAVNASKIGGRTIFVQNATPTAIATGDIWFQVAGL